MNYLIPESEAEFKGQIVDIFEDYLTEKGIILQNQDRENAIAQGEYSDPAEAAIIYGDSYGIIADEALSVAKEEKMPEKSINKIIDAFHEVLREGQYIKTIPFEDENKLRAAILDTFRKWGLHPFDRQAHMQNTTEQ